IAWHACYFIAARDVERVKPVFRGGCDCLAVRREKRPEGEQRCRHPLALRGGAPKPSLTLIERVSGQRQDARPVGAEHRLDHVLFMAAQDTHLLTRFAVIQSGNPIIPPDYYAAPVWTEAGATEQAMLVQDIDLFARLGLK